MVQAKAVLAEGGIGELVSVETFEGFSLATPDNPYVQPGAAAHWVHRLPGGIFQNLAPHPVYLLLAFLDPPKTLHAIAQKTGRVPTSFADELRVLVQSDNGLGCFMVSLSIQPFMKYVNVFGTEGSIRVNLSTNSLTVAKNRDLPRALSRGMLGVDEATQLIQGTVANAYQVARGRLRPYPGMGVLIEKFYRSIENNRPAPVDGEAGREVVRILDHVWQQIGRGTPPSASEAERYEGPGHGRHGVPGALFGRAARPRRR
jgi:predicted dehydrogenase